MEDQLGWQKHGSNGFAINDILAGGFQTINTASTDTYLRQRSYNSKHESGTHFLFVDGAVRFISENIEYRSAVVQPQRTIAQQIVYMSIC